MCILQTIAICTFTVFQIFLYIVQSHFLAYDMKNVNFAGVNESEKKACDYLNVKLDFIIVWCLNERSFRFALNEFSF